MFPMWRECQTFPLTVTRVKNSQQFLIQQRVCDLSKRSTREYSGSEKTTTTALSELLSRGNFEIFFKTHVNHWVPITGFNGLHYTCLMWRGEASDEKKTCGRWRGFQCPRGKWPQQQQLHSLFCYTGRWDLLTGRLADEADWQLIITPGPPP